MGGFRVFGPDAYRAMPGLQTQAGHQDLKGVLR